MKITDDSRQWDDLLEQTFGAAGKPDAAFSASAPKNQKLPFYRKSRFWLAVTALLIVIGGAFWFFPKETLPENTELPEISEALEVCKNALSQWQSLQTYHLNASYLHYGDSLGGASSADYWCSGKDLLYIAALGDFFVGYLQQDNVLYTASIDNSGQGNSNSGKWEAFDPDEIQGSLIPWPMSFNWDTSQIQVMSLSKSQESSGASHFSSVSFAVLSEQSALSTMVPYHVNFTFAEDETLESVTVIYTIPREGASTSSTVVTFRMGAETASEIDMKVGVALRMPLVIWIPTQIPRTDPA